MKEKKNKKKLLWLLLLIPIGTILFTGYKIYDMIKQYDNIDATVKEVIKQADIEINIEEEQFSIDWDKLKEQNPDIVGWIIQEDTSIDYPIVQGRTNDDYLRTDIYGNYSIGGTPFLDYRNTGSFQDNVNIVYGHNMYNGSMFSSIANYYYEKGYYDKHKEMILLTPRHNYKINICGYGRIDGTDDMIYNVMLTNTEIYANAISKYLIPGVDIKGNTKLIGLSTCPNEGSDKTNDRILVWGILERLEDAE